MSSIYKIGVSLAMTSNGDQVLSTLASGLMGVNVKANQLQGGLSRVKLAVGGVLAVGAGLAVLSMFKTPLDEAMKFETALARFRRYGLGDKLNADAERFAKSMHVAGANFTDAINYMSEAQGVFRQSGLSGQAALAGAKLAAPILAKLSFIESSLSPDEQASSHTQDLAMMRFVEARGGANDPSTFAAIADWGYRLTKSSGSIVPWSQLQQFAAAAGPMGRTMSLPALSALEPVIADLGGGRTASGLRVAFQRLLGTQRGLPRQAVAEFLKLGLWDKSKVELTPQGSVRRFLGQPGEVFKDRLQFVQNPQEFFAKTFLPALSKTYGKSILDNTPDAISKRSVAESLVFGPGNASTVFSQMDLLAPAISRSLGAQGKEKGYEHDYQAAGQTTRGRLIDAQKKFDDLMITFGSAVLPVVNKGLAVLNPLMQGLSTWMLKHTGIVKGVAVGLAVFGGALVAAGAVALAIAAGPIALWTIGITALAGVIAGFLAAVWTPLTKFWAEFVQWVAPVARIIGDVATGNPAAAIADAWAAFHHGPQSGQAASAAGAIPTSALPAQSAVPPSGSSQPIVLNHQTMLDGREIFHSQTTYLSSAFGANSVGPARQDPQASLPSPNWGYIP